MKSRALILAVFIVMSSGASRAQLQEYNHPELAWQTIETDHYFVHFHTGTERTAFLTADIAEYIYGPVTELYDYRPDGPVHLIIRDHDDISNGAAYYYDNKIEIWAPPMDFQLRGTHAWLENVVTHEFSHLISLGAARKLPRSIPAVYLQWMGFEKEKRPDVIHGYPNVLASVPLAGTVIPMWFAEGAAQFQRAHFDFDRWDSHRDMLLRSAVLEGTLLKLNEMEVFAKNSLGNEMVYEQGYAFVLYIAEKYGEKAVADLAAAMSSLLRTDFSGAVRKVLGMSGEDLYAEWAAWLHEAYGPAGSLLEGQQQGDLLYKESLACFYPVLSPDGSSAVFVGSADNDYMSMLDLFIRDMKTGRVRRIARNVSSAPDWSADGSRLVYAKHSRVDLSGSSFYDLYVYDLRTKKEKRLTRGTRARHPSWHEQGTIVSIVETDGTSNLAVCGEDGSSFRIITSFTSGEQLFSPRWLPSGAGILFAAASGRHGRDIARIDSNGSNLTYLLQTDADERDPFPLADGSGFIYAGDENGIFNLYRRGFDADSSVQLTNVSGGAFMPCPAPDGGILYTQYAASGFQLRMLEPGETQYPSGTAYRSPYSDFVSQTEVRRPAEGIPAGTRRSRPYKSMFSGLSFLPRVMMDHPGLLKLGTYFYGSDFLDKISLLGGAAANAQFDTDVFAIFEYRRLRPTLFLEMYHQQRHTSNADGDYRFQLIEVDLGADWRLSRNDVVRTAWIFDRYDARMSFEDQGHKFVLPYTYHLGNKAAVRWTHLAVPPSLQSQIAPRRGRRLGLRLEYASQRFIRGFKLNQDYGTLVEDYETFRYFQAGLDWYEFIPGFFARHSAALHLKAGLISKRVDSFYHLFAGGLDGLKGYPYYSIEGRRLLQAGVSYRLPLIDFGSRKAGVFHLNDLFLALYCNAGNAWTEGGIDPARFKRDAGLQLRLSMISFYGYPANLFFDAAYGFDRFVHKEQNYGGEWRFYFGILFDFLD